MTARRAGMAAAASFATIFAATGAHGADAAANAAYTQSAMVIDAGGTPMRGGGWTLDGSIGQPTIARINASGIELASGFWQASSVPGNGDLIFRDGFDPPSVQPSAVSAPRR